MTTEIDLIPPAYRYARWLKRWIRELSVTGALTLGTLLAGAAVLNAELMLVDGLL